eukprot:1579112-Pleurochrysis_carterae.AAC.2
MLSDACCDELAQTVKLGRLKEIILAGTIECHVAQARRPRPGFQARLCISAFAYQSGRWAFAELDLALRAWRCLLVVGACTQAVTSAQLAAVN